MSAVLGTIVGSMAVFDLVFTYIMLAYYRKDNTEWLSLERNKRIRFVVRFLGLDMAFLILLSIIPMALWTISALSMQAGLIMFGAYVVVNYIHYLNIRDTKGAWFKWAFKRQRQ